MIKTKYIVAILGIFILIGATPFVLGAGTNTVRINTNLQSGASVAGASVAGYNKAPITPSANSAYKCKIVEVDPWIGSDDCWVFFNVQSTHKLYKTALEHPTDNTQYLQVEMLNTILFAENSNQYITLYTDDSSLINDLSYRAN
jgi:hypothetical protein